MNGHHREPEPRWLARETVLLTALLLLLFAALTTTAVAQALPVPITGTVHFVVNLRAGPGLNYPVLRQTVPGENLSVFDCNEDCSWYQLTSGEWVLASLVQVAPLPIPSKSLSPQAPVTLSSTPRIAALTPVTSTTPALTVNLTPTPDPITDNASLTVAGWNVESGGSDPATIAERIEEFEGVALWGLSEVNSEWAAGQFEQAAGAGEPATFDALLSVSGGGDRLLLLYDTARFTLLDFEELHAFNVRGNVRSPLVAHLLDRYSGTEFLFMVNHLYRGDDTGRWWQAEQLNAWASEQTLPVVAVGDYNFDWNIYGGDQDHDPGYDLFVADGKWEWVQPDILTTTQCSGWPCGYTSVLDFVFVANAAQAWPAKSEIIVTVGDFPDNELTSDHRPVLGTFELQSSPQEEKPLLHLTPPPSAFPVQGAQP